MDTKYRKATEITIMTAGALFFSWLFFKYALPALMPLVLALIISALLYPATSFLSKKAHLPHKLVSVFTVLIFFAAISLLLYLALSRLAYECENLLQRLAAEPDLINTKLNALISSISDSSHLNFLRKISSASFGMDINTIARSALETLISGITSSIPATALELATQIPEMLFSTVAFLISTFYLTADRQKILSYIRSALPKSYAERAEAYGKRLSRALLGYAKAYLLIMLLTFLEAFVGLSVLKVNYSCLMAVIIAIVDALPILGTGTVLVPWAIFSFISSDVKTGIGLLIVYGIMLFLRQIAEPRIVGSSLGLHPLATLTSVYLGLRLFGIVGIFAGPITALIIKELLFHSSRDVIQNVGAGD